jgi:hypothetical protein
MEPEHPDHTFNLFIRPTSHILLSGIIQQISFPDLEVLDVYDTGVTLPEPWVWRELFSKHSGIHRFNIGARLSRGGVSMLLSALDPAEHGVLLFPRLHTLDVYEYEFRTDQCPLIRYLQTRKRLGSPVRRLELADYINLDDDILAELQRCVDHAEARAIYIPSNYSGSD